VPDIEVDILDSLFLKYVNMSVQYSRNDQQYELVVPLLYSIYWLLHVSVVGCHNQGIS
jgi:hypothetical protein